MIDVSELEKEVERQRKVIDALLRNVGMVGNCHYCPAQIFWVTHSNSRRTPYDPTGINHFATCPGAETARKEAARRKLQREREGSARG